MDIASWFHVHSWNKWEIVKVQVTDYRGGVTTSDRQSRECRTCGLKQTKKVWS